MCLCAPQPVYLLAGQFDSPLLDDMFGRELANHLRSLVGADLLPLPSGPFALSCDCTDSFLDASLSLWALAVVVVSFVAGSLLRAKKKAALSMLTGALAVSAADFAFRLYRMSDGATGERLDLIIQYWPTQLAFNLVFHIAVPLGLGLALALGATAVRRIAAALLARLARVSSR